MESDASGVALPGESIVWTGAAPSGIRFRRADALLVPFSLVWAGFVTFWEASAVAVHAPPFFRFWGLPFVAIGLYIVAGRFIVDAYVRSRMRYVVTDRAAYVVRDGAFPATRRYSGSALDAVQFEPRAHGRGTLRLAAAAQPIGSAWTAWNVWNGARLDAFEDVADAARVYELVVAAARSARSA